MLSKYIPQMYSSNKSKHETDILKFVTNNGDQVVSWNSSLGMPEKIFSTFEI